MTREQTTDAARERAVERRRTFHRYPEPSWCEFRTTSRLIDYVEEIDVDTSSRSIRAAMSGAGVEDAAHKR